MYNYLADIIDKLGEPIWWDSEAAIPRYCEFHPDELNNIYAREAALILIECQGCGHQFKISEDWERMDEILRGRKSLSELIKEGWFLGYSDPPNIRCCPAGPSMSADSIRVLEFWKKENFEYISAKTKEAFADKFDEVVCVMHPKNLIDEIPGKGSNMHYAERMMQKYVDKKGWNYANVIATIFDIDTVCDRYYFSYMAYLYCTNPEPTRTSYQPVALYNNNMWESPAVLRVMAFGTTFWLMTALAQQDSLVTFSSHSMSWRALVDAGFHDKRIVSEDSRIFYQCFLAYNGKYKVTPMYIPVSMDTVRDDNWWQSIKNLYKQQRRWAWGVEHVPYLIWEFKKKGRLIPLWKKIKWIWNEWEGKWSWALVAIIITFLPRLPLLIASDSIKQSALYFNTPFLLQYLITSAMVGLLLSALLSFPLLPKAPKSHSKSRYITMVFQWLLLPFSMIFVSAIPAIDAVTHLMFGRYLGFNVSQKKRK